ncbi:MAG: hypothetical protein MR750_07250, partial [Methanobrevibacter boviskoreani]
IKKIYDEEKLLEIGLNSDNNQIKEEIVDKIYDEDKLKELFIDNTDVDLKSKIAKKIDDENVLYSLYDKNEDDSVKKILVEKIYNEDYLKEILKDSDNASIRKVIVNKITDIYTLNEIAEKDEVWQIRAIAYEKLGKIEPALEEILNNTNDSELFYDSYNEYKDLEVEISDFIENKRFFMDTLLIPYEKTLSYYQKLDDRYPLKELEDTSENKIELIKEREELCKRKIKEFKTNINKVSSEGKDKILYLALSQENYENHKVVVELTNDREILNRIARDENEFPRIKKLAQAKLEEIDDIIII